MLIAASLHTLGVDGASDADAAVARGTTVVTLVGGALNQSTALGTPQRPFAVAAAGDTVYIADPLHEVIRALSVRAGIERTVAGTGEAGYSGAGVLATKAPLDGPSGVATDRSGDLFISDSGNGVIRFIPARDSNDYGQEMVAGHIYSIANGLGNPWELTTDPEGDLFLADSLRNAVDIVPAKSGTLFGKDMKAGMLQVLLGPSGALSSSSPYTPLESPRAVAFSAEDNCLFIADTGANRILALPLRTETLFDHVVVADKPYAFLGGRGAMLNGYSSGISTEGLAVTTQGDLVFSTGTGLAVAVARSGPVFGVVAKPRTVVTLHTRFPAGSFLTGMTVLSNGNLVVADQGENYVWLVSATSERRSPGQGVQPTIIAGNGTEDFGGDGMAPRGADIGTPFGVAWSGWSGLVVADTEDDRIRVVPTRTGQLFGEHVIEGRIWTVTGNASTGPCVKGVPARETSLADVTAVALDATRDLYFINDGTGQVCELAGATGEQYGQIMKAGRVYVLIGNGGPQLPSSPYRSPLGAPTAVGGLAVDGRFGVVISDLANDTLDFEAARNESAFGMKCNAGHIYRIAGGGRLLQDDVAASRALLGAPRGLAVEANGNIVFSDPGTERLRLLAVHNGLLLGQRIMAGRIYTIAGDKTSVSGVFSTVSLQQPQGLALDSKGDLFIANEGGNDILELPSHSGVQFGQQMRAGRLYDVAGDGRPGFAGDGGASQLAELFGPMDVVVGPSGSLIIADTSNNRVREVCCN